MEQNPCDACRNADCAKLINPCTDRLWFAHTQLRWIPVSEMLPVSGRKVISFYRNDNGKPRRIMAYHADPFSIESDDDDQHEAFEYSEENDQYYLREGWYENNEFDDVNWCVSGCITHWMELPPPPVEVA